jgi:hypothetical protein
MSQVKRKRKVRVKTYASLKNALDRVFSRWTRIRFADSAGMVRCVTCGAAKHWSEMQAGHFQKRHYLATRWHPENVHPQDAACNVFRSGAMAEYAAYGVNRYGMDWPARMVSLSKIPTKYTRFELQQLIEDYTKRLEHLEQTDTSVA